MKRTRLSDSVADEIKMHILEGVWVSGERLPSERELAERFGVSRPSLREALHTLIATGLLRSQHGGGTYVADTVGASFRDPLKEILLHSPDAQRDLFEFRYMVEGECSYYAAQRATDADKQRLTDAFTQLQNNYAHPDSVSEQEERQADENFHLTIAESSHNAILLHTVHNTYEMLRDEIQVNFGGVFSERHGVRNTLIAQHQALYDAIMNGQPEQAMAAAQAHIRYIQTTLAQMMEESEREARALRRSRIQAERISVAK